MNEVSITRSIDVVLGSKDGGQNVQSDTRKVNILTHPETGEVVLTGLSLVPEESLTVDTARSLLENMEYVQNCT